MSNDEITLKNMFKELNDTQTQYTNFIISYTKSLNDLTQEEEDLSYQKYINLRVLLDKQCHDIGEHLAIVSFDAKNILSLPVNKDNQMTIGAYYEKYIMLKLRVENGLVNKILDLVGLDKDSSYPVIKKGFQHRDGFYLINKQGGSKFYVNATTYSNDNGNCILDPRELLIMKMYEYLHMGPKIYFISAPSIEPSTREFDCFVIREDICSILTDKEIKEVKFYGDGFLQENKENYGYEEWKEAIKDEDFKIKLLALSIVEGLCKISGSLEFSPDNYGFLKITTKENKIIYYPVIVDISLKSWENDYFLKKHPVLSLIDKLYLNSKLNCTKGILFSYTSIQESKSYVDCNYVIKSVELFKDSFISALDRAKNYVSCNVNVKSEINIEDYCASIKSNLNNLLEKLDDYNVEPKLSVWVQNILDKTPGRFKEFRLMNLTL